MFSQVDICNKAILPLGSGKPIQAITENTQAAILCKALWDTWVDEVLSEHDWSFARKWIALAEDAAYTFLDSRYDTAYNLPGDFIRFTRTETSRENFERRGAHLVSNNDALEIEYIYRLKDYPKYPIYFVNALAARARVDLYGPLAKKGSSTLEQFKIYKAFLAIAMKADAQQENQTDEEIHGHTNENETFLSSRTS